MLKVKGKTPDDVIRAVYAAEGWTRVEGEGRVKRCYAGGWTFSKDQHRGVYFATKV